MSNINVSSILDFINDVLGPINFLYTTIFAIATVKLNRKSKALKLVCKINEKQKITEKERINGKNGVPVPVIVQNNSDSVFQKVFIIVVGDESENHVKIGGRLLNSLSKPLQEGHFGYIENLSDQEEILISSYGYGMHRRLGIVVIYEDERGKEWVRDSNGKLYKTKGIERKLIKLGLPLPGYKSHITYRH